MTFQELGLNDSLLTAITELGYETPTPIQESAIPYLLQNNTDLVGLAQTGTGKTAAFGLPILNGLDLGEKTTQALIIAPTRELGLQIAADLKKFSKHMRGLNIVSVYGGASIMNQIREIERGAHIIVATPGRMVDLLDRKKVKVNNIKFLVLDEADEMLNMGFKDDLDVILKDTPKEKQTLLFSATMPTEVRRIANNYMNKPHEIAVAKQSQSAENIEHHYYEIHERDRYAALKRIIDYNTDIFGIIFCRTRHETQDIADKLIKDGYNADSLHGDLSQAQRDHVMKRYRSRGLQLLVATDVAARGIDVSDVTHVLNYNLPDDVEVYTHRSGRTARAGKHGISLVLINTREFGRIKMIERSIGKKFTKQLVPNAFEICDRQLLHLIKRVHDVPVNEEEIAPYLPTVNELFADMNKEDILKHFVSIEFNRFLDYYRNTADLNNTSKSKSFERGERGERSADGGKPSANTSGQHRMFINIGSTDGLESVELATYISDIAKVNANDIRAISLRDKFSFFNIEASQADAIMEAFKKEKFNGRSIRVDITEDRGHGNRSSGGGENRGGGERRSYGGGENRGGGERRSYGGGENRGGGERRSYGGGESRSGGGERRSYGAGENKSGGAERTRSKSSTSGGSGGSGSSNAGGERKRSADGKRKRF